MSNLILPKPHRNRIRNSVRKMTRDDVFELASDPQVLEAWKELEPQEALHLSSRLNVLVSSAMNTAAQTGDPHLQKKTSLFWLIAGEIRDVLSVAQSRDMKPMAWFVFDFDGRYTQRLERQDTVQMLRQSVEGEDELPAVCIDPLPRRLLGLPVLYLRREEVILPYTGLFVVESSVKLNPDPTLTPRTLA